VPLQIAQTERLRIRWFEPGDCAFILELVNEPSWIRYIGNRGVNTLEDATGYIRKGPMQAYERLGFGLYLVELKQTGESIGMCGLIKREALQDVDLGFAFLPQFRHRGYAFESAAAVMSYARDVVKLPRIVAILSKDNDRSLHLLGKLGFRFERTIRLQPDGEEIELHASALCIRNRP
jgi:RimJ/RimL family protein N-acetyltransferase